MKDPEKQNDYYIKLTGKANIPEPLNIGHNYSIIAKGTIDTLTESDNNDGSHALYFKFKPVTVEIENDLGERIKAEDTRSLSQVLRSRIWSQWNKSPDGRTFEEYYNRLMHNLIQHAEEITEMYSE